MPRDFGQGQWSAVHLQVVIVVVPALVGLVGERRDVHRYLDRRMIFTHPLNCRFQVRIRGNNDYGISSLVDGVVNESNCNVYVCFLLFTDPVIQTTGAGGSLAGDCAFLILAQNDLDFGEAFEGG